MYAGNRNGCDSLQIGQHVLNTDQVFTKDFLRHIEKPKDLRVSDRVENAQAFFTGVHNMASAENCCESVLCSTSSLELRSFTPILPALMDIRTSNLGKGPMVGSSRIILMRCEINPCVSAICRICQEQI